MLRVSTMISIAITVITVMAVTNINTASAYSDFYQKSKRGWFWFEQQAKPEELRTKQDTNNKATNLADSPNQTATEELKQFQEQLEEKKAAMIMQPSIENTREYIKYQNEMYRKAGKVSQNIREVMLLNPELNIAREIPISDTGVKIRNRAEKIQSKELLKQFAKRFKLLFFYKGSCSYCTPFAEVLEVFAHRYGYKVASVTLDGKSMSKFPASQNIQLTEKFNVSTTPALFAYSEELGIAVPMAQGFLAIDELENNASYVASKLKGRLGI